MEETPNHGLNKYTKGERDWTHSPDMQTLEERVPVRDLEENLGTYTPHAGAKFEATDTERQFIGDGDAWTRVASTGQDPEFESVTAGEIGITNKGTLYRAGEFVEIFGAQTDTSVGSTSNTTSVRLVWASGGFPLDTIPEAATLKARFTAEIDIDDGTETFDVEPRVHDTDANPHDLTELRISTSSTARQQIDSGWQDVTTITPDDLYVFKEVRGHVSAGTATGTFRAGRGALLVGWQL